MSNNENVTEETMKEETKETKESKDLGYQSIIPQDEIDALKEVKKAVNKFIDVHNNNVLHNELVISGGDSPYSRIQYCKYSEVVDDLIKSLTVLHNIDLMDKEFLDKMAEKAETNIKGLENKVMLEVLMSKLR